jgi:5-methylcytosine-specific restriction protein A
MPVEQSERDYLIPSTTIHTVEIGRVAGHLNNKPNHTITRHTMGLKPLHNCNHPGCNQLTRERYCPNHTADADRYRGGRIERGYDKYWMAFRIRYLQMNPLCVDCLAQGITEPADEVHHVKKLRDGGAKLDPDNCMALSHRCHAVRTGRGE